MKKLITGVAIMATLFAGCNGHGGNTENAEMPEPGTVVAQAEYAVKEDTLNKAVHAIKVTADSAVTKGVYDIDVTFGKNFAHWAFTMPKGGEKLKPLVRRGEGHTYIVGFRMKDDTTFYDYVEVRSMPENIQIKYMNSYSFQ